MKKFILFCLIVVAWGCSSEEENRIPEQFKDLENLTVFSSDETPTQTFSFKKEGIFGDSEEVLIGRMGDIAVDSLGRVFIADLQQMALNVFEPNGRFETQLGREGRGPLEFDYIKSLKVRNNHLYAFDFGQNKVHVFNLETLTGIKTNVLARNRVQYPNLKKVYPQIDELFVTNHDTYIAKFKSDSLMKNTAWQNFDIRSSLYPLDNKGKVSSTILLNFKAATGTQVGNKSSKALLGYHLKDVFGNKLITLSSDDTIFIVEPDHFLIKVYNLKGEYQSAFYYPNNKIPLTEESAIKAELPPLYLKNWESIDAPENWPTVTDLKIDDQDRLWVAVTVEDMNVYEWWVVESSGEVITKFEWSRDKPIQKIRDGYLYTKEKSEEGADFVVRYLIQFNGNE